MYSLSIVCTEPINNYVFIYLPISVGKPVGMSALISASTVAVTVAVLCINSVYAEHSIHCTVYSTIKFFSQYCIIKILIFKNNFGGKKLCCLISIYVFNCIIKIKVILLSQFCIFAAWPFTGTLKSWLHCAK